MNLWSAGYWCRFGVRICWIITVSCLLSVSVYLQELFQASPLLVFLMIVWVGSSAWSSISLLRRLSKLELDREEPSELANLAYSGAMGPILTLGIGITVMLGLLSLAFGVGMP